jgi:hypothetical protein
MDILNPESSKRISYTTRLAPKRRKCGRREERVPVISPTGPPPTIRTSVSVTVIVRKLKLPGPSVLAFEAFDFRFLYCRDKMIRGMCLIGVPGFGAVARVVGGKPSPIRPIAGIPHRDLRRRNLRANCLDEVRELPPIMQIEQFRVVLGDQLCIHLQPTISVISWTLFESSTNHDVGGDVRNQKFKIS